jgi:Protein of unknown function (DUF3037)
VPAESSYEYAAIRVVPRVESGEFVNVGVILICRQRRFLRARVELGARQRAMLETLDPEIELSELTKQLDSIVSICRGDSDSGPIGKLSQGERFHWLTAPASTIIQTSPIHSGLSSSPADTLEHLVRVLVHHR